MENSYILVVVLVLQSEDRYSLENGTPLPSLHAVRGRKVTLGGNLEMHH